MEVLRRLGLHREVLSPEDLIENQTQKKISRVSSMVYRYYLWIGALARAAGILRGNYRAETFLNWQLNFSEDEFETKLDRVISDSPFIEGAQEKAKFARLITAHSALFWKQRVEKTRLEPLQQRWSFLARRSLQMGSLMTKELEGATIDINWFNNFVFSFLDPQNTNPLENPQTRIFIETPPPENVSDPNLL